METKAEGDRVRERRRSEPVADPRATAGAGGEVARGPPLSGTSYWLDFWFMIFLDLVLFVFVYLLP